MAYVMAALVVLGSVILPSLASAETIDAASCERADVQAAVDAASAGDTVRIPEGECTWDERVTWRNSSIAVIGAGMGRTVISCDGCFQVMSTSPTSEHSGWRLSGMTLRGDAPGGITIEIWDNVGSAHYGWRIDHMELDYPGAGSGYGIFVGGPTYGVIDHNQIHWGNGLAIIVAAQLDTEYPATLEHPQGGYLLGQPLAMGSLDAVYIEDNTFTSTAPSGCAAYDTSSGGGRAVFRHNTLTGCIYYSHWTRGLEIGGILHEIYGNTFQGNAAFDAFPIRIEAGTGVIFDNTVSGFTEPYLVLDERRGRGASAPDPFFEEGPEWLACDGTRAWDGNAGDADAPGWPCLGQIGRAPGFDITALMGGARQASAPLHVWNNGTEPGCASGGACTDAIGVNVYGNGAYVSAEPHPNGEVDYVLGTPAPGYTPLPHPHPLVGVEPGTDAGMPIDGGPRVDASGVDAPSATVDAGGPSAPGSCSCHIHGRAPSAPWLLSVIALAAALVRWRPRSR